MTTYTITLTDAEDKALGYVAVSQQEWIDNAIKNRCRIAIDEIFTIEAERISALGGEISGTKEEIVLLANIESALERNEKDLARQLAALERTAV
jgi:hypothetical protein